MSMALASPGALYESTTFARNPKPSLYMQSCMVLLGRTLYESKAFTIHGEFHGTAGYWC